MNNGTPLQYSCLENPMDGGAWWAAVHGVAKSRARLSNFTFTSLPKAQSFCENRVRANICYIFQKTQAPLLDFSTLPHQAPHQTDANQKFNH